MSKYQHAMSSEADMWAALENLDFDQSAEAIEDARKKVKECVRAIRELIEP